MDGRERRSVCPVRPARDSLMIRPFVRVINTLAVVDERYTYLRYDLGRRSTAVAAALGRPVVVRPPSSSKRARRWRL